MKKPKWLGEPVTYIINGEELKAARWRAMLKQVELADSLGCSSTYLCEIEKGHRRTVSADFANSLIEILKEPK